MFLPGTSLSDGEWHRIEIKWLGSDISVALDYGSRLTLLPMSANKIQGLYVGKILIGGADSLTSGTLLSADYGYFEGCIQVNFFLTIKPNLTKIPNAYCRRYHNWLVFFRM